jgi:hypothetical protein
MSTFVNAIKNQEFRTDNGMKARKSSANACVDLFYQVGASRGKNIIPAFTAAYVENSDLALRIMQHARDVRGGSGERELFRQVLTHLETVNPNDAMRLMAKIPDLGRWDDLFVFKTKPLKDKAYTMLGDALRARNGLAAKWTPRKGDIAVEIRTFFGMTPKQYRKSLVNMTTVVETAMCAKDWDKINYSHVPSLAHARYKKAFGRNGTSYAEYVAALVKGVAGVKVNAGAVYPHDVLKGRITARSSYDKTMIAWDQTELDLIQKQWEAMPNFIGDSSVLPLVDVSGSMEVKVGGDASKSTTTCLEVAVSMGLYFADKNKGVFKDAFLTFSSKPELLVVHGGINEKIDQMCKSEWGGSTDLHAAFNLILATAIKGKVAACDMPETLVILSDMQFNSCVEYDDSAMEMIARKFSDAGYTVPQIVFWNLRAADNTPVAFDKKGVALVSGFSPAVVAGILGGNPDEFTPEGIMLKSVMQSKYDLA